jgi:hypothetical protein
MGGESKLGRHFARADSPCQQIFGDVAKRQGQLTQPGVYDSWIMPF